MTGPFGRSGVTGVQMAFILDDELQRPELGDQPLTQALFAGRAVHGGAASDCAGFILRFSHITWGIMNTSIAAVIPKTLNFTHIASE